MFSVVICPNHRRITVIYISVQNPHFHRPIPLESSIIYYCASPILPIVPNSNISTATCSDSISVATPSVGAWGGSYPPAIIRYNLLPSYTNSRYRHTN